MKYLFILFIFIQCANSNKNIDPGDLVEVIEKSGFIEKYGTVRVSPVLRGMDKLYVEFSRKNRAYVQNYDRNNPNKLNIVRSANVADRINQNLFSKSSNSDLTEYHKLLVEMEDLNLVEIRPLSSCFQLYTSIPSKKGKFIVILHCDSSVDKSELFDLETELNDIRPQWYSYESDLYSEFKGF